MTPPEAAVQTAEDLAALIDWLKTIPEERRPAVAGLVREFVRLLMKEHS